MKIKLADIEELDDIMQMYNSCVSGMIKSGIDQWDNKYPNKKIIKKDIESKSYYVAIINGEIIGGINIDQKQDKKYLTINWEDRLGRFLVVHRLAVKKEYWNSGIGKSLMLFVEDLVVLRGLNSIRLDTYIGNPKAMNFYQKLEYKQLGYIYLKEGKDEYYCFEKIIS